ncbi:MAG TPA: SRPBCC family protein [Rhabdaerophilum sp.]|nr:SRPBCC family protein [Rhabdaerophilum sp.]
MGSVSLGVSLLVLVLAGVLYVAARRPDTFRVVRKAVIAAPAEAIFPHLNDFRAWAAWSPWERKDPAMQRTFGDRTEGAGAFYGWEGNKQVGKGSMTITESVSPVRLALQLDFEKPMKASNRVEFSLVPVAGGTEVVWSMSGKANLMSKVMDMVIGMDKMVGPDFEAGLANLKAVSEKPVA